LILSGWSSISPLTLDNCLNSGRFDFMKILFKQPNKIEPENDFYLTIFADFSSLNQGF